MRRRKLIWLALLGGCSLAGPFDGARAERVTVAVAANFRATLQELASAFESTTSHEVAISSGSTGQLFAQIRNGAPFDILLSADQTRPRLLADAGLGDPDSVFTYAVGRLALWSVEPALVDDGTLTGLRDEPIHYFAIADPEVAPYGAAATEVLEALGVHAALEGRLVTGLNVSQAFAMAATGNAELGLVALAQAVAYAGPSSYRVVPRELHGPIRQDAMLLNAGAGNAAAVEFLEYLRSDVALATIERHGYDRPR